MHHGADDPFHRLGQHGTLLEAVAEEEGHEGREPPEGGLLGEGEEGLGTSLGPEYGSQLRLPREAEAEPEVGVERVRVQGRGDEEGAALDGRLRWLPTECTELLYFSL